MGRLGKTRWVKCLSKIVSSLYSIWRVTNYRYVPLCTVKKDALGTWHISLKRTAFSPRAFFTPMSSISAFCFLKKALQEIFLSFLYLQVLHTTYIDQNIKNKDTRSQTLILFHGNSGIDKNKILSKETWINVYVTLWRIKWAKSVSQTSLSFLTIESSHDS